MEDQEARPILLVGSSGGHLAQMLALRPWWASSRRLWVTFDTPDATDLLADEEVVWAYYPTTRSIPNLMRNTFLAVRVLRDRPALVISTGAGVAVPFFVLAWLMRIPTIYIEVFDRIDSLTLTAKLCMPFATNFLVQWPEQLELSNKAELIGPLL